MAVMDLHVHAQKLEDKTLPAHICPRGIEKERAVLVMNENKKTDQEQATYKRQIQKKERKLRETVETSPFSFGCKSRAIGDSSFTRVCFDRAPSSLVLAQSLTKCSSS